MRKKLNLYPIYYDLILTQRKTTTVRLGEKYSKKFEVGEKLDLTIGWNEDKATKAANIEIVEVVKKKIKHVTIADLVGESPDCILPDILPYILGSIYRKVVNGDDFVTIISWKYR